MEATTIALAHAAPVRTRPTATQPSPRHAADVRADRETASVKTALRHIADDAMFDRSRNIAVLTASITKYLLTTLDPALELAEEIRAAVAERSEGVGADALTHQRAAEALGFDRA